MEQHRFNRSLPSELGGLLDLALDLRWTWSHATDQLWRDLDPEAWERTGNPYYILQNVSQARLEEARCGSDLLRMPEQLARATTVLPSGPRLVQAIAKDG